MEILDLVQVFIVEDDPMVSSICKSFIEKVPPFRTIGICGSEEESLVRIRKAQPDLILIDIQLNGGSGLNLLKQLRAENIPSDAIFITAAKDGDTILDAFRYGAIDYLIKPFDFDRLRQSLRHYLQLMQLTKETREINQKNIDQYKYFAEVGSSGALSSLPKGVHYMTLNQLNEYLETQDSALSCQQISQALSLSKITTWRYLEYLVEKGKVGVTLEYGMIGRPTKLYRTVH